MNNAFFPGTANVPEGMPFGLFNGAVQHPLSPATGTGHHEPLILTFFVDDSFTTRNYAELTTDVISQEWNRFDDTAKLHVITMDAATATGLRSDFEVTHSASVHAQTALDDYILLSATTATLDD